MKEPLSEPEVLLRKILHPGILLRAILQKVLDRPSAHIPKRSRSDFPDSALNALEMEWWDSNANLTTKTWEFDDKLTHLARGGYLSRAASFFKNGELQDGVVLELGCGSGWVGRYLAQEGLQIYGTDFSQSQIDLARARAEHAGLETRCTYGLADSTGWPQGVPAVKGVLIHAFLHHLDGSELNNVFEMLKSHLSPGTRVWMYEPAFYEKPSPKACTLPADALLLKNAATALVSALTKDIAETNLKNTDISEPFAALWRQAEQNGWYLTPKEVPFDIDEFTKRLSEVFPSVTSRWETIFLIGWLSNVQLISNKEVFETVSDAIVPMLVAADKRLAECDDWLRNIMLSPMHAFRVWECIL